MPESFRNNGGGVTIIRVFAANDDDALQVCRVQQAALIGFARRAVRQHDEDFCWMPAGFVPR